MGSSRRLGAGAQRGVSLIGLLFWAIVLGFIGYVLVRVLPTVNEYLTIQSTVRKIAASNPSTVGEIRAQFDKQKEIEYSIASISGKDLDWQRLTADTEWLGIRMEQESDLARRQEAQERSIDSGRGDSQP